MTIQTELATVQADVTAEINKSTAQIAVAKQNNDLGQEYQAIQWLYMATQTNNDLAALTATINALPATPHLGSATPGNDEVTLEWEEEG